MSSDAVSGMTGEISEETESVEEYKSSWVVSDKSEGLTASAEHLNRLVSRFKV